MVYNGNFCYSTNKYSEITYDIEFWLLFQDPGQQNSFCEVFVTLFKFPREEYSFVLYDINRPSESRIGKEKFQINKVPLKLLLAHSYARILYNVIGVIV